MKPFVLVLVVALALAGGALAANKQTSTTLKASLNAKQEVPPQSHKASGASGRFTGTLTPVGKGGAGKLSWHLAFANLSSPVKVAYVFVPPSGKTAQVIVQLCIHCSSASGGVTETLPADVTTAISTQPSYVVILTTKNPKGEIRGRMTASH